ncbi:hypothetical protein P7H17_00035 [Paenibacillus larvae]|nr:hypothetical protein [Paenibacillus larvae]MDT2284833.1 hypothetical protein [Paenibacillus larvae]
MANYSLEAPRRKEKFLLANEVQPSAEALRMIDATSKDTEGYWKESAVQRMVD